MLPLSCDVGHDLKGFEIKSGTDSQTMSVIGGAVTIGVGSIGNAIGQKAAHVLQARLPYLRGARRVLVLRLPGRAGGGGRV